VTNRLESFSVRSRKWCWKLAPTKRNLWLALAAEFKSNCSWCHLTFKTKKRARTGMELFRRPASEENAAFGIGFGKVAEAMDVGEFFHAGI